MNEQENWQETIGNDFDEKDMKSKTIKILKSNEEHKKEIEEEEKKYLIKFNSLTKEKRQELRLEVEKIAMNRPYGKLAITKKTILFELMDKVEYENKYD